MNQTTFEAHGYLIDLERLYRAMYEQSAVDSDGSRVFHGNSRSTRAMKRLLNDLFEVPVQDTIHPVNDAIRHEVGQRLADLGWATKDEGRTGRYVLHRGL